MSVSLPILYSFRRCPYAMRARLALVASGMPFIWREILLRDKPAEMLEKSPKGTVPVLVLPDGAVIDESLDVMLWALSQGDPLGWLPDNDLLRRDSYALIERNDGPFKHHLDRYKYASRYEDVDGETHRTEGMVVLKDLDSRLAVSPFWAGDEIGLADMAIFPFVRQFRVADIAWFDAQALPHLHRWLSDRLESDLFAQIMVKRPVWAPEDEDWIFEAG